MRSQMFPCRWLILPTLFLGSCSGSDSPSLTSPSSISAPAAAIDGSVGASADGDVKVGTGTLEIVRLRMTGGNAGGLYVNPGGEYGVTKGATIELWAEWNPSGVPRNPRFIVNWGEFEADFTGCGSCKLTHRYNTEALFQVTASLDDLSGTMVTRKFTLDARPATTNLPAAGPGTQTFLYTGSVQTFTVPPGVTVLKVEAWGASGGAATNNGGCQIGGKGGHAWGDFAVSPGATVWVSVGGEGVPGGAGGWNGGGDACSYTTTCASGGGASDLRAGGQGLNDRVLVGAGGGGAEYSTCANGTGGNGGGLVGDAGSESYPNNGGGGTQVAGGAAGSGYGYPGTSGTFGVGGTSADYPGQGHSGGGGGGWWGGGGSGPDGHGGGGSSYYGAMSGTKGTTGGVQAGNGRVVITW